VLDRKCRKQEDNGHKKTQKRKRNGQKNLSGTNASDKIREATSYRFFFVSFAFFRGNSFAWDTMTRCHKKVAFPQLRRLHQERRLRRLAGAA
jgi:hypothetical protein